MLQTLLAGGAMTTSSLVGGVAPNATVSLNSAPQHAASTVMTASNSLSSAGWNHSIQPSTGVVPAGTISPGDTGAAALFEFSLNFTAGQGFTFLLRQQGGSGATSTVEYLIPASRGLDTQAFAFDALRIDATATNGTAMLIGGLSFQADGQEIIGSLADFGADNGSSQQFITANANMGSFDWTLTGWMQGLIGAESLDPSSVVSMNIAALGTAVVPLPPAAWAGLAGLGMVAVARRIARRRDTLAS